MEGPLEVKDSATGTEEPIKSEAPVQSPGSSNRSDGAASPPPNCSICLGNLVNTSFTDSCLHQFCFTCLLQWSKIKTECPLCKQTFKSIIHNVRSEEDYDQYHVPRELASQMSQPQVMATLDLNFEVDGHWDLGVHRFLYRTTMTGNRRHGVVLNPEQVTRREQLPSVVPEVSWEERRRRRANPAEFRRTVYRLGVWAAPVRDVLGNLRTSSVDYYRREPNELNRLMPWLNRELQVLLNNNSAHVAYVMTVIRDALSEYNIRSPEFRDLMRRYFGVRTDHFVHELSIFARTHLDLRAYDQSVIYMPHGLLNEYLPSVVSPPSSSSSTSSDDSDVRVVDEAIDLRVNTEIPSVGPHPMNMPGPSTVGQAFQLDIPYNVPDVLTISSNSSTSDDECEVIGYVKPRHERTPEIIELLSSDPEEINVSRVSSDNAPPVIPVESAQPSTIHTTKKGSTCSSVDSSSPESDSDSDSDYTCRRKRRYQSRGRKSSKRAPTTKRRNRSVDTKSRNRASRNLSSSGESESRIRVWKRSGQRTTKKRSPSTSDFSSQESKSKKTEEKRTKRGQYYTRGTVRVRKDLIKVEDVYTEDSSSSDSSSDTDEDTKTSSSRALLKSKRTYANSSSDFETGRSEKVTRTRGKKRQNSDPEFDRKEQRHKENRQSRSRSSSASSYVSQKDKKMTCRRRESQRDINDYGSHDDSNSMTKDSSRKEHESRSKSKAKRSVLSSSDTDDDRYRSNSQCSKDSTKSYVYWKKSKYKDRHKSKERKRSSSKTYNSSVASSSTANAMASTSLKPEAYSTSKHSESKNNSSSKERRKFHKNRKESKHKRSQSDTKSKSKKKRRRIRSSTSSNSE